MSCFAAHLIYFVRFQNRLFIVDYCDVFRQTELMSDLQIYDAKTRPLVRRRVVEHRYGISPRTLDYWLQTSADSTLQDWRDAVFQYRALR